MATRTLNFYGYNLKQDVTLMLMFSHLEESCFHTDKYPAAWKAVTLRSGTHCKASVTYVARPAIGIPQFSRGNITIPETWVEIQEGEVTSVIDQGDVKGLTPPVAGAKDKGLVSLKNRTSERVNVTVGFVKGDGLDQRYEVTQGPTWVEKEATLKFQYKPIVSAYVKMSLSADNAEYSEVQAGSIWTRDLNVLSEVSNWNVIEEPTGSISLERADSIWEASPIHRFFSSPFCARNVVGVALGLGLLYISWSGKW